ncbi:ABC transporter ATP-binding protein [Peptoniphilus equinus]|uniref:ABC transporter ATP-binding protein n=1 Tax=Peptoniphilus equinus TaxID=3016343 RepID=A0ABY7QUD8_9FIRM|nr:ABC transporter ATP-binding protein [Peptoniphilus equinus]WBW49890.1 ABC transporter ATP-binding protein [Peptoniphilus equinus]
MLRTLLSHVKDYKIYTFLCPVFVIIEIIMDVLIPYFMSLIIDVGIVNSDTDAILRYGLYLILAVVVAFLTGMMSGYLATKASAGFAKNLRFALFTNIQDFAFQDIEHFQSGSLITRMTTDVQNIQAAYQMGNRLALRSPLLLIFALFMSLRINAEISLSFLIIFPILIIGLSLILSKAHPLFERIFKTYDHLNTVVAENLLGIRVVKSFVQEDHETEKFSSLVDLIFKLYVRASKLMVNIQPLMMCCTFAATLLISYFGTQAIWGGTLQTGQLISLVNYAVQIQISLMMLSMVFMQLVISKNSAERVVEVLETTTSLDKNLGGITEVKDGSIAFDHVHFSYVDDDDKCVLSDINLDIASGANVGIIGLTGSSKSTLISLIPRLYDANKGSVKVGGVDVRDYNLKTLRDSVAVVLQKNTLFSGTVRENLKWGNEQATDEQIQWAAKIAQAHDFIMATEHGYDTIVERGGTNFSGGQRQRLCIARALLKRPQVLILDDSTSALDNETEQKIVDGMQVHLPSMTRLTISQRINSLEHCDTIIVMAEGKIRDRGTHEELMTRDSIYQEIASTQGGDFDEPNA